MHRLWDISFRHSWNFLLGNAWGIPFLSIFCLGLQDFVPEGGSCNKQPIPEEFDKRGASNNDKRHKTASTNAPQRMTASGAVLAMALFAAIDTSAGFGLAPTPISYGLQRWSAATRRIDLSQRAATPGLPSSRRSRLPFLAMSVADDDGEQPRVLLELAGLQSARHELRRFLFGARCVRCAL